MDVHETGIILFQLLFRGARTKVILLLSITPQTGSEISRKLSITIKHAFEICKEFERFGIIERKYYKNLNTKRGFKLNKKERGMFLTKKGFGAAKAILHFMRLANLAF